MAKRTIITYVCDRCGREITESDLAERHIVVTIDGVDVELSDMHAKCADRADALLRQLLLDRYPGEGKTTVDDGEATDEAAPAPVPIDAEDKDAEPEPDAPIEPEPAAANDNDNTFPDPEF